TYSACSSTSAFSFSSSTTARRTVQTLIGSNVALRTSTRPDSRPRRRCSGGGADPTCAGGTDAVAAMTVGRSVAGDYVPFDRCAAARKPPRAGAIGLCGRKRAEHAQVLDVAAQRGEGLGDRSVVVAAFEVGEEHVAPEPLLARARLDPREVDAAQRELRQAAHEPAGGFGADAPEDDRRLPRAVAGGCRGLGRVAALEPHEARLVAGGVVDVGAQHLAAVQLGGGAAAERRVRAVLLL